MSDKENDDSVFTASSSEKVKPKQKTEDYKRTESQDGKTRKASGSTATNLKPGEQNIVIALDGSDESVQAVNWYLEKVHRPGNRLVFVHIIELPEPKLNEARHLHMSPGVLASMWKDEENKVKDLEQRMKALLKEKQIKGVLRTATGKPGEVICRIADEEQSAMICVGTRGMGRMRRTILGSVSDYLVNHAHCPVIVCRSRSRKQSGDDRARRTSGDAGRKRHFSGESLKKLFHLGGKSNRSQSQSSENEADNATTATTAAANIQEEQNEDDVDAIVAAPAAKQPAAAGAATSDNADDIAARLTEVSIQLDK